MIIWLNGAFGAGKSSAADSLHKRLKNSFVYDPEQVGYFLWDNFPTELSRKGNFQHIPIWRNINYQILKYLNDNYLGTIIVPMTIYIKDYFNDIIQKLRNDGIIVHHFILYASKPVIIERLKSRGDTEDCWAAQHIDKCLSAFDNDLFGTKIYTDTISIEKIVSEIAHKCNISLEDDTSM